MSYLDNNPFNKPNKIFGSTSSSVNNTNFYSNLSNNITNIPNTNYNINSSNNYSNYNNYNNYKASTIQSPSSFQPYSYNHQFSSGTNNPTYSITSNNPFENNKFTGSNVIKNSNNYAISTGTGIYQNTQNTYGLGGSNVGQY